MFDLCIHVSISALQTRSSIPCFWIPHTGNNTQYLFLSFKIIHFSGSVYPHQCLISDWNERGDQSLQWRKLRKVRILYKRAESTTQDKVLIWALARRDHRKRIDMETCSYTLSHGWLGGTRDFEHHPKSGWSTGKNIQPQLQLTPIINWISACSDLTQGTGWVQARIFNLSIDLVVRAEGKQRQVKWDSKLTSEFWPSEGRARSTNDSEVLPCVRVNQEDPTPKDMDLSGVRTKHVYLFKKLLEEF